MNVLVTGSEGFIGRELCKDLSLFSNVIEIDRKTGIAVKDITSLYGVDVVYHLAAQTSVFNENKPQIIEDNYSSFIHICDLCSKYKTKLIYASSSSAFNSTSLYGLSKQFNEQYASMYYPYATGVRLHNVYGPNPRKDTLLYNLLHGHTIIYSSGKQKRHFTFIDDVIDGLISLMDCEDKLVNICNPEYVSVKEFVDEVAKYKYINPQYVTYDKQFDKDQQLVDNNINTLSLNYTSIKDGLRKIQYNLL